MNAEIEAFCEKAHPAEERRGRTCCCSSEEVLQVYAAATCIPACSTLTISYSEKTDDLDLAWGERQASRPTRSTATACPTTSAS